MKIEIDLDDVFRGEDSAETSEEAIRREIIERLSGDLRKRLFASLDAELSKVMTAQIKEAMKEHMPALINDIMNTTYTPVNAFGQRGEPTNFRNEIIKSVTENLKYTPSAYSSEENVFTRSVKSIVEHQTKLIEKEIIATADKQFATIALNVAVTKLAKQLGIKLEEPKT